MTYFRKYLQFIRKKELLLNKLSSIRYFRELLNVSLALMLSSLFMNSSLILTHMISINKLSRIQAIGSLGYFIST